MQRNYRRRSDDEDQKQQGEEEEEEQQQQQQEDGEEEEEENNGVLIQNLLQHYDNLQQSRPKERFQLMRTIATNAGSDLRARNLRSMWSQVRLAHIIKQTEAAKQSAEAAIQERDAAEQRAEAAIQETKAAKQSAEAAIQERDAAEQEIDAVKQEIDAAKRAVAFQYQMSLYSRRLDGETGSDPTADLSKFKGKKSPKKTLLVGIPSTTRPPLASLTFPPESTFEQDDSGNVLEAEVGKLLTTLATFTTAASFVHTRSKTKGTNDSPDFTRYLANDCVQWTECAVSYVELKSCDRKREASFVKEARNQLCRRLIARFSYFDVWTIGPITMRCGVFTRRGFYPVEITLRRAPVYVECKYNVKKWTNATVFNFIFNWLFAPTNVMLQYAVATDLSPIGEYQPTYVLRRGCAKPSVSLAIKPLKLSAATSAASAAPPPSTSAAADTTVAPPQVPTPATIANSVVLKTYEFEETFARTTHDVKRQLLSAIRELNALRKLNALRQLGKSAALDKSTAERLKRRIVPNFVACLDHRNNYTGKLVGLTIVTSPVGMPLRLHSSVAFMDAGKQLLEALVMAKAAGLKCHGDPSIYNIVEIPGGNNCGPVQLPTGSGDQPTTQQQQQPSTYCLIDWGEAESVVGTTRRGSQQESTEIEYLPAVTWLFAHPTLRENFVTARSFHTDAYAIVMSLIFARGYPWSDVSAVSRLSCLNDAYQALQCPSSTVVEQYECNIINQARHETNWRSGVKICTFERWCKLFGVQTKLLRGASKLLPVPRSGAEDEEPENPLKSLEEELQAEADKIVE